MSYVCVHWSDINISKWFNLHF